MIISEVSKKFDISLDTLRYYEKIGLIPHINRSSSGIRNYTDEDCRWIEFVKCMRSAGIPVEVLIEYISLFAQGEKTASARMAILRNEREKLAFKISQLQDTLQRLDYKIENYQDILKPAENKLKLLQQKNS